MSVVHEGAAIAALAGALCLAACGPGKPPPKTDYIIVDALTYGPAPHDLRVGDTVRWVNKDIVKHSATARDGSFDVDLPVGASGTATLSRPGVLAYYCRYHPNMTGNLTVSP